MRKISGQAVGFFSFLAFFIVFILVSIAQNSYCKDQTNISNSKVVIITYKSHEVLDAVVNATIKGLVEIGNIPRENIEVFNPNGKLDDIQSYVRGLNSRTTSLIISVSTPSSQAVLSSRHPNIPVLYSFVSDPTALKLSDKSTRKLNVTGISNILDYENGIRLLKKIVPNLKKIGVMYNPSESNSTFSFNQIRSQAKMQNPPIDVISRQFSMPTEIQTIASTIPNVQAIYVGGDNALVANIPLLISIMNIKRIPVFASDEGSVRAGAIAAYSIDYSVFGRKSAEMALKILMQGNADNISPVEYKEGRCLINTSAFKKIGLAIRDTGYKCIEVK